MKRALSTFVCLWIMILTIQARDAVRAGTEDSVRLVLRALEQKGGGIGDVYALRKSLQGVVESARNAQEQQFFNLLLPEALRLMHKESVPASASIAMAIYESNYGRSGLAKIHHNYFGIKAFRDWKGARAKNMLTVDSGVCTRADFRRYATIGESTENYASFLKGKAHYRRAFTAPNGVEFVRMVLKGGYCPDRDYLSNIKTIMERHQLLHLDTACLTAFSAPAVDSYWMMINGG
jgi:flagellum-specific peptidoglycan hydrolase FlgJ